MKKSIIGTTLALSLFATTAFADGNAPAMVMDESVVKNQTANAANPESTVLPIIVFTLLVILASKGGGGAPLIESPG